MANSIIPFEFQSKQVRVLTINDEPWFVAKDVCEILELADASMSCKRLSDRQKGTNSICTPICYFS